jgi:uncharacterized OsmC-like protein
MKILVEYESGTRFIATCDGHQVTTGKADGGYGGSDGMWPAQLFAASLGMCIGGYVASYCKHHNIPCEDMRVEVSRTTARAPSRTTRVEARIDLGAKVSQKEAQAILRVADRCHITNSIKQGMEIVCVLADEAGEGADAVSRLHHRGVRESPSGAGSSA